MNDDNGFGVPAGWYPDPLGLPQMRWWDNHGWTEHTTEARAPIVIQEAKLAYADDDELPTRREARERERDGDTLLDEVEPESAAGRDEEQPQARTADPQLEIESPLWDQRPFDFPLENAVPETAAGTAPEPATSAATTEAPFRETQEPATPEIMSVPEFAGAPLANVAAPSEPAAPQPAAHSSAPSSVVNTHVAAVHAPSTNTPAGWIIALIPLLQLVASLLVVAAVGGSTLPITLGIWIAPYFIAIPLAVADNRALKRNGYEKPASWGWIFLSAPVYLVARAISIVLKAGNGFGPLLTYFAVGLLQVGSIVAVPGLIISALPEMFTASAEQSIADSASIIGTKLLVTCPTPPATVIGQQFICKAQRTAGSAPFDITASLERANGWIDWRVDDWGVYSR
ncbi:MAG: hypothetical protein JWR53_60 [Glaciihabitans sp.]|nr:hypothetical protein [Glaciihabitans sp.]